MIAPRTSTTHRRPRRMCWLTGRVQLRIADVVRHFVRPHRPPMVVARCPGCGGWHDVTGESKDSEEDSAA
ncbi:MAG: hypothetical protein J2P45_21870 [Candidatus Dormibacteraeota bacterium]|nr:hypothetical protein [Candidatus Dormibacteraeota bacterium]